MKQIKFLAVAMAAVIVLLTSCLGDSGSNSYTLPNVPGQIEYTGGKIVVNTGGDILYSNQMQTMDFMSGDWVFISYTIDYNSEENANAATNGYYVVQLSVVPTLINEVSNISQTETGLDVALTSEIPLTDAALGAGNSGYYYYFNYVLGHLLLTSTYDAYTDQKNEFFMVFNPNQETTQENGINIYNVYIRAIKLEDGKSPLIETGTYNMYDVERIIEYVNSNERGEGKSSFGLKFNYVKEIDEETGEVTWASTANTVSFAVSTTDS